MKAENSEYVVEPCDGGRWVTQVEVGHVYEGLAVCSVCLRPVASHETFMAIRRVAWSTEVAKAGWYWYRPNLRTRENFHGKSWVPACCRGNAGATILRVDTDGPRGRLIVRFPGTQFDVVALGGEWGGPLREPFRVENRVQKRGEPQ